MFVGITRAQQELQLSTARYRDFRGERKLTIPSSFLMELPREEMELEFAGEEEHEEHENSSTGGACENSRRLTAAGMDSPPPPQSRGVAQEPRGVEQAGAAFSNIRLTTAAALLGGGRPPPADADAFRQGLWVVHSAYGLGQIIALSGSGAGRKATIDFSPPVGRKRVLLAEGSLQAVGQ